MHHRAREMASGMERQFNERNHNPLSLYLSRQTRVKFIPTQTPVTIHPTPSSHHKVLSFRAKAGIPPFLQSHTHQIHSPPRLFSR